MLTTIPLGEKPYVSPYHSIGIEICKNLYIEQSFSDTAKAKYYLLKIPGLKLLATETNNSRPCRGIFTTSGQETFVVHGNEFKQLFPDGNSIVRGTINTTSSICRMAENGRVLILVDGSYGYIYDLSTHSFNLIEDGAYPNGATHVTCINTYFIVNVPGTNEYRWSNSYYKYATDNPDGSTSYTDYDPSITVGYWSFLQFSAKIGKTDLINGLLDCQNMIWLFGQNSIEVHYNTDQGLDIWTRYAGALIEIGTLASNSIAKYNQNIFWLGTDQSGTVGVYSNQGLLPVRISTRGIEQIFQRFENYNDCVGSCYAQAGHVFYVMNFLQDNRTFVFDVVTNSWHERTYLNIDTGLESRHRSFFYTYNWNENITGDCNGNAVYWLSVDQYANDNPNGIGLNYINCEKTTPINFSDGKNVAYRSVQLIAQQGTGLTTGSIPGTDINDPDIAFGKYPKVIISWSNDAGTTWVGRRTVELGAIGKYSTRSRLVNVGMGRNRVWKINCSEPVQVVFVGLLVDAEPMTF